MSEFIEPYYDPADYATNHTFAPSEVHPALDVLPERAICYTYGDLIVVDKYGRMWIDTAATAFDWGSVEDTKLYDEADLARIIKLHNGYAVDESHLGITSRLELNERFTREASSDMGVAFDGSGGFAPVVAWAGNQEQYVVMKEVLAASFNMVILEDSLLPAYEDEVIGELPDEGETRPSL